jgi:hypothetical protein
MTKIKAIHPDSEDQTPLENSTYSVFLADPIHLNSSGESATIHDCRKKLNLLFDKTRTKGCPDFLIFVIVDADEYDKKDWQNVILKKTDMADFTAYNPVLLKKKSKSLSDQDLEDWYDSKLNQSTDVFIFLDYNNKAPKMQSVEESTLQKLKNNEFVSKRLILGVDRSFWNKGIIQDITDDEDLDLPPKVIQFAR